MHNCLIIDDDPNSRFILSEMVKECGGNAIEAKNAKIALKICRKKSLDYILLDWMMPGTNGIQFLNELEEIHMKKQPHIVMCTACSGVDELKIAFAAGVKEYLNKPIRLADIEKILENSN